MNKQTLQYQHYHNAIKTITSNPIFAAEECMEQRIERYLCSKILEDIIAYQEKAFPDIKPSEVERIKQSILEKTAKIVWAIENWEVFCEKYLFVNKKNKLVEGKLHISKMDLRHSPTFQKLMQNQFTPFELYEMKENYQVVVISPFGNGKSTLVNALFGDTILKSDVRAETANITKLFYGSGKRIVARWNDQRIEEDTYQDLLDLTSKLERLTSAQISGNHVQEIIVEIEKGIHPEITLVDSPGLFSRYSHHDEISKNALMQGDLILFLVDAARVGETNYMEFLKRQLPVLFEYRRDICFVISKLDLYSREEEKKIKKELYLLLQELQYDYLDLIFLSAYQALQAQLVLNGKKHWKELGKDKNIFVEEDGFVLRGREIREEHTKVLLEQSRIDCLTERILASKEIFSSRKKGVSRDYENISNM